MNKYIKKFSKEPNLKRNGFAGEMELLLIMNPKFSRDGEIVGEDNDLY